MGTSSGTPVVLFNVRNAPANSRPIRSLVSTSIERYPTPQFKRRGSPDPHVQKWLPSVDTNLLWTNVLILGEIRKGIERLPVSKRRAELEIWVEHDAAYNN